MTDESTETKPRRRSASRPAGPPATETPVKKTAKTAAKKTAKQPESSTDSTTTDAPKTRAKKAPVAVTFQPPDVTVAKKAASAKADKPAAAKAAPKKPAAPAESDADDRGEGGSKRRRRRGGSRRGKGRADQAGDSTNESVELDDRDSDDHDDNHDREGGSHRRRRRRRRSGQGEDLLPDDPPNTVVRVRESRSSSDDMQGSTRLQAKKNRRREGREHGRRRTSILSEAEFLARREDVERKMVVRQGADRVQIAVLEDGVLVEHYVNRNSGSSMIGNVYLGRVQNVLPGMEAAFIDIGRGRNAVLYAGEVNWDAAGLDGQPKRIEFALKTGDPILVQVTKDPVGHKGARLTAQVSLPGRFLVYVPDGSMTGISRKLPDTERSRLKRILRSILPEEAGVIVRTAAEGASEEELTKDVARLSAQWEDIASKSKTVEAPALLYSEPDLAIKVVRDIFNEDFKQLIVAGDDVHETLHNYVSYVAPDLADRLTKWVDKQDVFAAHRVDEQLSKALDRKVYLPSGGSLVIDRTEAMTVVDVNTGKFTGEGGTLEDTVTQNNLEAAEEIVRQLRLRDIGGIIVVDFIDMVHEANRDKVVRRLIECLGRDRTKHQVAEVSSLGLVQMTRKRIGQGLLETFSETCDHCNGRGVKVSMNTIHVHDAGRTESEDEDRPKGSSGAAPHKGKALAKGGRGRKR